MGHSTGGLLAQLIADRGLSAATVAIDPGPFVIAREDDDEAILNHALIQSRRRHRT